MMSFVFSRNLCRVVARVNRGSCPTLSAACRTLATSNPKCGEASDTAVTLSQLKSMLSGRTVQLFDVRSPDEHRAGRIPGAVNIPLDTLEESLKLSPDSFQRKFEVRAPGKNDDNVVFHCRSGKRSAKALDIARQLGFCRARHYEGGYSEWAEKEGK